MQFLRNSLFIGALFLAGCGDHQSQTITVYVSADEQIAREVIDAFTEQTGIRVKWVGDTEASKTTGLVTRLRREAQRPVADVFWSSENIGTIQLASVGVFAPYHSRVTESWPEQYRDAGGLWYAFSPRARVIAYDPLKTEVSNMPTYWWEYADAAIADPRDRKSTRLNSSHVVISYAVFCLKKKKIIYISCTQYIYRSNTSRTNRYE